MFITYSSMGKGYLRVLLFCIEKRERERGPLFLSYCSYLGIWSKKIAFTIIHMKGNARNNNCNRLAFPSPLEDQLCTTSDIAQFLCKLFMLKTHTLEWKTILMHCLFSGIKVLKIIHFLICLKLSTNISVSLHQGWGVLEAKKCESK